MNRHEKGHLYIGIYRAHVNKNRPKLNQCLASDDGGPFICLESMPFRLSPSGGRF